MQPLVICKSRLIAHAANGAGAELPRRRIVIWLCGKGCMFRLKTKPMVAVHNETARLEDLFTEARVRLLAVRQFHELTHAGTGARDPIIAILQEYEPGNINRRFGHLRRARIQLRFEGLCGDAAFARQACARANADAMDIVAQVVSGDDEYGVHIGSRTRMEAGAEFTAFTHMYVGPISGVRDQISAAFFALAEALK